SQSGGAGGVDLVAGDRPAAVHAAGGGGGGAAAGGGAERRFDLQGVDQGGGVHRVVEDALVELGREQVAGGLAAVEGQGHGGDQGDGGVAFAEREHQVEGAGVADLGAAEAAADGGGEDA